MICCDTCPYWPTCEDEEAFMREVFGLDDDEETGPGIGGERRAVSRLRPAHR